MKTIVIALMGVAALFGQGAQAVSPNTSPLIGQWDLETSTLPMPPELRPKSAVLLFRDAGAGKLETRVEIVDQNNNTLYSTSTLSLDGVPGKATGTYWVDVITAKMPAPNVLIMQFVYESIPRSTRIYSVGGDEAVLTETETYFKEDGTPMMRTAFFRRSAGKP